MSQEFEVRDFREKNWYWQDNEYLNGYARLCGVSATAVYLSLCRHADKKQNCFPSVKLIAEEHNISERTVINAIHILEKHNIIKKEKTRKNDGKWLNNSYILLNKSQWVSQVQPLHMDSQVQITTEPSANNDVSQVQPLHTNKTHREVNPLGSIANVPFAPLPFSLKDEITKLEENPRRDLNIIAFYLEQRMPDIRDKDQLRVAIKRHLRAAGELKVFTDDQIVAAAKKAKNDYKGINWTIETLKKILTK